MRIRRLVWTSSVAAILAAAHAACGSSTAGTESATDPAAPGRTAPPGAAPSPTAPTGIGDGGAPSGPEGGPARPPLPPPGPPVETLPPNATGQTPAFENQTRAPSRKAGVAFTTRIVASGLEIPWGMAFLPDGALLVTERPGRMRIVRNGVVSAPVQGVPPVDAAGQGGLLDVALDPAFATNGLLYFSYAEARDGGNGTTVARARLVRDAGGASLADLSVIWRQMPAIASTMHFGGRIVVSPEGYLYVTLGERGSERAAARQLGSTLGKVVRITTGGAPAPGNPFAGQAGAMPEIWTYGHRNIQGAALNPLTGELWTVEHGARGGDEVNVERAGKDHGWAKVTYGIDYSGAPIGEGITSAPGIEQPIYFWDPSIAPSGAAFYEADAVPAWKGSLFVGALAGKHLVRLTIAGERVVGEERLLENQGRIRDVRVSPAGTVYVSNESTGQILELVPVAPSGGP